MGEVIRRYESLIAWQKAKALTAAIYAATRQGAWAKDYGLAGQIQRAAVSIPSNIAEGFERGGRGEFAQFLSIAKGSCAEVRTQLAISYDVGYLDEDQFNTLMAQAEEVGRLVGGLRAKVSKQRGTRTEN
jgi:four helix bundle protein